MNGRKLAVFDLDDTLIHGDSLWKFLPLIAGWPRTILFMAENVVLYFWWRFQKPSDPALEDRGTFLKHHMLQRLLAGKPVSSLQKPIAQLKQWRRWNNKMRATLQEHFDAGHQIVIATGALDLYVKDFLADLPPFDLLCTDVEIKDGLITSNMPHGNCVREGKARRLKAYLDTNGPFDESWGYGNYPHDVPMMALLRHRIIV